jgi:flagellar protein FlaG
MITPVTTSAFQSGARSASTELPAHRRPAPPARADAGARAQPDAADLAANDVALDDEHELSFEYNRELERVIVKLVDKNTREVVRQLPSEEALAIARALARDGLLGVVVRAVV